MSKQKLDDHLFMKLMEGATIITGSKKGIKRLKLVNGKLVSQPVEEIKFKTHDLEELFEPQMSMVS